MKRDAAARCHLGASQPGLALFFFICALLNTYIAFNLPQEVWVNFKVFGLLGMTLLCTLGTVLYLYRHLPAEQQE